MKSRKALTIALFLFVALSLLPAKVSFRPDVSASFGGAFCIPTADYLKQYPGDASKANPPVRTSWFTSIDFNPVGLYFDITEWSGFGIEAGVSYTYISQSLAYGISVLKPYDGFGFDVHSYYQMSDLLTLGAKYRCFDCRYTKGRNHFLVQDVELVPSLHVAGVQCRVSVTTPVTVSFKADAVTLRFGIGCNLAMDVSGGEGR